MWPGVLNVIKTLCFNLNVIKWVFKIYICPSGLVKSDLVF